MTVLKNWDDATASRRIHARRDIGRVKLSIGEVAKILDVRRATLSDLVNGKAALSPEMALRIEKGEDGHAITDAGMA